MNTLADIRTRVLAEYKRRDTSVSTVNRWIVDAVRRIQRTLVTPIDEAITEATVPVGFDGSVQVPGNLVQLLSLQSRGRELTLAPIGEVKGLQRVPAGGHASIYAREGGNYLVAPIPAPGTDVEIYYRADFAAIVADTDTCPLFDSMPDLVMFGALIYAAGYSKDDDAITKWNAEYNATFTEIQDLADRNTLTNAAIRPAFSFNGGAY